VWCLGLFVHSFLLTAAAPGLTRSRAVTVHVTGSAVASVMPFGGAAGLEVHRRMLRSWGVGGRAFAGYALLITTWGIGCKLLLPLVAAITLGAAGETVTTPLRAAGLASGLGFLVLVAAGAALLASERWAIRLGGVVDGLARRLARSTSRSHQTRAATAVVGIRHDCSRLVANGWARMTTGIAGYAALQCLLLGVCLHLAGAGNTVPEVVTGFAVERMVTILPITPGGVGVGDLGLVTVLLAFGGNPAGVAAAALLYRTFVFTVEVPVGACLLGLWLLRRRASRRDATGGPRPAQPVERALARSSVVRSPLPDEHP